MRHINAGRAVRWSLALLLAGLVGGCGHSQKMSGPGAPDAGMPMEAPAAAPPEEAPAPPVAEEAAPEAAPEMPPAAPGMFDIDTSVEAIPPPPAEPETYEVIVPDTEYQFLPRQLTIYAGDSVVWRNESGVVHLFATIPGSDPTGKMEIEPEDLLVGGSVTHTFQTAGTYPYFCFIHNQMTGRIVVLPR